MNDGVRRSSEHRTWHLPGFVPVLRWALIGCLAVGACAAVLTSWRDASASDYRDALATRKISEVVIGPSDLMNPALTLSCAQQSQDRALVGWSAGPWPWQRFATDEIGTNQAARLAREEGVVVRPATTNWPVLMMLGVFLAVVATLAYGPQPRRFTKWAAFWWSTLPFGVGLLWLLVREAPWSRTASALPELLPHGKQKRTAEGDPRFTGGLAFLVTFLVGTVLNVVVGSLVAV